MYESSHFHLVQAADWTPPPPAPRPAASSGGAPPTSGASSSSTRQTLRPIGTVQGAPLGYFEYLSPDYGTQPSPLLMFLHGSGESGTGDEESLAKLTSTGIPSFIANDKWPDARPLVVLAPQHNADPPSFCLEAKEIDAFLRFALQHYDVDPRRVYVTGLSCGAIRPGAATGNGSDRRSIGCRNVSRTAPRHYDPVIDARLAQGQAVTPQPSQARLTGRRAVLVWMVVVIDLLLVGAAAVIPVLVLAAAAGDLGWSFAIGLLVVLAAVASCAVVGAIIAIRLPRNPIGWILWAAGAVIAGSIFANEYATLSAESHGGTLPGTAAIAVLSQVDIVPMIGAVGIFLPMLFPDGHLPSPRWRWVAWYAAAGVTFATLLSAVAPGQLSGGSGIENPLGIPGLAGVTDVLGFLVFIALGLPAALALSSLVWRYRRTGPVERRQLKWFASAVPIMFVGLILGTSDLGPLAEIGWIVLVGGFAVMPIAIGIAILRYRLYEIDRIISRTIGYLIVTGILATVFVTAVLISQAVLGQFLGESPVGVAASTLVVAALFQPLRVRVQRAVDRRFNRARYDAERTVVAFTSRLRDQVELATVRLDLVATVDASLRPTLAGVWLRDGRDATDPGPA